MVNCRIDTVNHFWPQICTCGQKNRDHVSVLVSFIRRHVMRENFLVGTIKEIGESIEMREVSQLFTHARRS